MSLETFRRLLNGDINLKAPTNKVRWLSRARGRDQGGDSLPALPAFEPRRVATATNTNNDSEQKRINLVATVKGPYAGEAFFPGLPFDGVLYAEHLAQADVNKPFTPDTLLGMSARQFIGKTTGGAKRDFSQIRKLAKEMATNTLPEDLLGFSVGAGLHTRRVMLLSDYLHGKSAPVIEFILIDHWRKLADVSLPKPHELKISGELLGDDCKQERLVTVCQYQEMLIPILEDLSQLPREVQLNPDARAWAIFNAWWAIASLYGDPAIIADASPLWPEAMTLLDHIAEAVHGHPGFMDLNAEQPRYPIGGFEDIAFLKAYHAAGATTPDLFTNWDILEQEFPDMLDSVDALADEQDRREQLTRRRQREAILNIYSLKQRANGVSLFERLLTACDSLGKELLDRDVFARISRHMSSVSELLGEHSDTHVVEVTDDDNTPASSELVIAMLTWLTDADDLLNSIETEVEEWNDALRQAADTEGSLPERMAATQRASESFAEWQTESQEALTELIERARELPWLGTTLHERLETGDSGESGEAEEEGDDAPSPEDRIEALEAAVTRAETQMKHHRHRAWVLQQQLDRASGKAADQGNPGEGDKGLIAALREYSESTSCQNVLQLLQAAHPNRVRVLPSAIDSASDADSTLSANGLLRKVHALIIEGWDILAEKRPPYDMQNVIPCELALNESDTTRSDARCMQQRTFQEKHADGTTTSWEMSWHLKLDHRHRLYFAWDDDSQQIVIGHAGAHLGLAAIRS